MPILFKIAGMSIAKHVKTMCSFLKKRLAWTEWKDSPVFYSDF